jgi:hypothetical protein
MKMYFCINDDNLKTEFIESKELQKKFTIFFNKKNSDKIKIPDKVNEDSLKSMKVLLNQAIHYESQIMPFAYAINLSISDVNNEIKALKSYFD